MKLEDLYRGLPRRFIRNNNNGVINLAEAPSVTNGDFNIIQLSSDEILLEFYPPIGMKRQPEYITVKFDGIVFPEGLFTCPKYGKDGKRNITDKDYVINTGTLEMMLNIILDYNNEYYDFNNDDFISNHFGYRFAASSFVIPKEFQNRCFQQYKKRCVELAHENDENDDTETPLM